MKLKLVALTLIAFVCWLVPLKTLAQETYKPKTETKTQEVTPPSNERTKNTTSKSNTGEPLPLTGNTNVARSSRTPTSLPSNGSYSGRHYSKEEVQQLIRDYSAVYGISPAVPLCIARLESGFNQFSKNKNSTASGVFQYLSGTWNGTDEGRSGLSVFDADANVKAAVKYMAIHKNTRPWVVAPKCPRLEFLVPNT